MGLSKDLLAIINKTTDLNDYIEKSGDMSQYWVDVNTHLNKGFTLPVNLQNTLDDINASIVAKFKQGVVDIQRLTAGTVDAMVKEIELGNLGFFLVPNGVSHYYHCTAGNEHPWRIEIDLKVIPTVSDKCGAVKAGLCFISVLVVTGDIHGTPKGQIPTHGKVFQASKVIYIGPPTLTVKHQPILVLGNSNQPTTNNTLGTWLYFMRNTAYEDHMTLIAHDQVMY